jgi:hypothetical protein
MIPESAGFGLHHVISSGELWGTVILLLLFLVMAGIIATAIGHRRLAEIAAALQRTRRAAARPAAKGRALRTIHG